VDSPDAGPPDALNDAGKDVGCATVNPFTFDPAKQQQFVNVSTSAIEHGPRLSVDELTLVFYATLVPGAPPGHTIYVASRALKSDPFSAASPMAVNSNAADRSPMLSADGLSLYFASDRDPTSEIYLATRASTNDPFGNAFPLTAVNTTANEGDPFLSFDGQELFLSRQSGADNPEIYRAIRSGAGFGGASLVAELSDPAAFDRNPVLSADGLNIYFASNRVALGDERIWMATRPTKSSAFGAPTPIGIDGSPGWISPDNCRLYFSAELAGGAGFTDIYVAERAP